MDVKKISVSVNEWLKFITGWEFIEKQSGNTWAINDDDEIAICNDGDIEIWDGDKAIYVPVAVIAELMHRKGWRVRAPREEE